MPETAPLEVRDASGRTFLSLDATGHVTGYCGHVDLGTGVQTALSQIVAEELDLPLERVTMVLGDTSRTPDQGPTIASETIQVSSVPLRQAAATLRAALLDRARLRLNAPREALAIEAGRIHHAERCLGYGDLIETPGEWLEIDPEAPLKPAAEFRLVGQKTGRRDLPDKLVGAHEFIHDVVVAGMVHGHVVRPPYAGRDSGDFVGTSLIGYDEAAVADMPGFIAIVREGDFLGAVAERSDQARAIAEALPVQWRMPPPLPDMGDLAGTIRAQPATPRVLDTTGSIDKGLDASDRVLRRSYVWPYHLHGSIGPSCSVADWNDGAPILWTGSQNPHMLRGDLATLTGLPPERIDVRRHQAAGCYGRNCADDVGGDALLMSRAVGRPVRVQLTRAQETLWEPKGAGQIMDVEGGLKDGALHAYRLDTWYPSNRGPNLALLLTGAIGNEPRPVPMGDRTVVPPYSIPNKRITVHDLAPIVRAAWMRGVSALPNTFAHECFIDEMAAEAGADPVAFRLKHVADPRQAELIRQTAEKAGWSEQAGPRLRREGRMAYGQGFAFATYVHGDFPGTAAASAAWVCAVAIDTQTGEVTLSRVFVGQDQGLVINPDGVRQQIHGNVHQTAGRVLNESVSFDAITPTQKSWADYSVIRMDEVPEVETLLIERPDEPPLGVGESAAVPSAAAISNAIFDATGVRMREAPFTPERMRAALREAGYDAVAVDAAPAPRPRRGLWRRAALALGTIGSALTVGAVGIPTARSLPPVTPPPASSFSAELLEQGRQVFATGNCSHCHTAVGGAANAGGLAVETPFGTIWTTNITPDPETGLGRWSFAAFDRAMRRGISRDGSNLYPAFPYTSFAGMSDEDMFALYAYMQTLEPVRSETPKPQMLAPTNLRLANAGWNLLFHQNRRLEPDPAQSAEWNRGRYLVETVGHCSACHSPRNALAATKDGAAHLTGAMVKGWYAPPIAGPQAAARGWDKDAFAAYLKSGHASGIASAAGPMADVVANLQEVESADLDAMATYLASLTADAAPVRPAPEPAPAPMLNTATHRLFENACAVCHEPALEGIVTAAQVPLGQSMAVRAPSPETAEIVIREGLRAPDALDLADMPGFAAELSETQIADLARYLRARYAPDLPAWPEP
ncbi:molybdopterin cofactor-binding domain-containing protein [Limimaricola pyoseonensis]|uniref:Nicotinate dehydrogenase subunit B n=1 Tax=Limimaricola pyoseonensis TaxID=521013 RepID=A0A1G7JHK9_9RHOB|nr:molybdopterin cofactor-binding domain-containing protein [Limimaricola pyoseonensis]SDF24398.1 nicotinate dehydrogenase subunit B [Limimaricola pyoseonensis]